MLYLNYEVEKSAWKQMSIVIFVHQDSWTHCKKDMPDEMVVWVILMATFNCEVTMTLSVFTIYRIALALNVTYRVICLVVHIRKVGERLVYPRVPPKDVVAH